MDLTPKQIVAELDKYIVGQGAANARLPWRSEIAGGDSNCPTNFART